MLEENGIPTYSELKAMVAAEAKELGMRQPIIDTILCSANGIESLMNTIIKRAWIDEAPNTKRLGWIREQLKHLEANGEFMIDVKSDRFVIMVVSLGTESKFIIQDTTTNEYICPHPTGEKESAKNHVELFDTCGEVVACVQELNKTDSYLQSLGKRLVL